MTCRTTLLGSYLEDFIQPRDVPLADMDDADAQKPMLSAVARRAGLPQSSLSRKLSGQRPITEAQTVRLAHRLGASPVAALLLRLADVMSCEPGSLEEMVQEVVLRESGQRGAAAGPSLQTDTAEDQR